LAGDTLGSTVQGASASGSPTGTDVGSTPGPSTTVTEKDQLERKVDTAVVVNISGDVLDSDETGLRITKILNDAFDKQGVVVRRGVFA
jgi:hypothetical protein